MCILHAIYSFRILYRSFGIVQDRHRHEIRSRRLLTNFVINISAYIIPLSMTKSLFESRNLRMLTHQKAQVFRNLSVWKNILLNLVRVVNDQQDEHGRRRHTVESIIWFVIRIIAIIGMILSILDVTLEYKKSPTVTIPETNLYQMRKINYPAIAICNINRISHKAMNEFTQELLEFESITFTANLTLSVLTHMSNLLGQLHLPNLDTMYSAEVYNISETENERIKLLHTILKRSYNGYDVDRIMRRLSPKCRSMIQKCSWRGTEQMCDSFFLLRKTQNGYCCTFNYVRRNNGFGRYNNALQEIYAAQNDVFTATHIERQKTIGSEYGLSILLNPLLDDYAYKILPINGFKILVYDPSNHPDVSSGNVREVLISPRTETYIDLDATRFYTTEDVQKYDIQKRDCLFQTEQSKIFHGYYSFSDCIVHCRIRDIFQLCNCVPFFYPTVEEIANTRVCNLKDLFCLKKFKERWLNVKPRFEDSMVPFNESEFDRTFGYLTCDCLPSCTDVTYNLQSSSIPLSLLKLSWGRKKYQIKNHSVVHIYFRKSEAITLRQDVLFYWYELMSNYGGVCSLFLGVSVINVIEILYRSTIRIWNFRTAGQLTSPIQENQNTIKNTIKVTTIAVEPTISEPIQALHWQEMMGALPKKQSDISNLLNPLLKQ